MDIKEVWNFSIFKVKHKIVFYGIYWKDLEFFKKTAKNKGLKALSHVKLST